MAEETSVVEQRVDHIADLMRQCRWLRGKTYKRLAEDWGLSRHYVRELAAEASRRVRTEITDRDAVTVDVCTTLARIMRKARRSPDAQDVRNAIQAAKTWAEISGAMAPQKHEVTGAAGAPIGLPPQLIPLWPKAQAGDPDALAAIERWVSGGGDPGKGSSEGGARG